MALAVADDRARELTAVEIMASVCCDAPQGGSERGLAEDIAAAVGPAAVQEAARPRGRRKGVPAPAQLPALQARDCVALLGEADGRLEHAAQRQRTVATLDMAEHGGGGGARPVAGGR